ncbi:MAG: acetyltransferase [Gammaproteobacteria bacterium]|nr:acetyltransferase [Gammaproteobacteria bacterium]
MKAHNATPLLIFPCNGNGLEALDCLGEGWYFKGFVDDTAAKQASGAYGFRVMPRGRLADLADAQVLAVPGGPTSYRSRRQVIEGLQVPHERFARVIHPTACISSLAKLGHNVLIMAGVVVTSNAVIGSHVCVLPNTVVHHDAVIGDWSLVGSNVTVSGGVAIGRNCYIGSGSSIMHGIRIGDAALVGIGSNVIRDVAAEACVAGNPAHILSA